MVGLHKILSQIRYNSPQNPWNITCACEEKVIGTMKIRNQKVYDHLPKEDMSI
jgi:hypothetical protein